MIIEKRGKLMNKEIKAPITKETASGLKAGDYVFITGDRKSVV